jgi:hypothetical protein
MTDPRDQFGSGAMGEIGQHELARGAVRAAHLHLDEFMIAERACGFAGHGVGETVLTEQYDRLERVRAAAQVSQLVLGERHAGDYPRVGAAVRA